jgi:NAD(P)-dependent dehydrogenase (short-subunit alcohol dehydrogenase family)
VGRDAVRADGAVGDAPALDVLDDRPAGAGANCRRLGVNSISPGIVPTPLPQDEMNSQGGPIYRRMIETSASGRVGTTDEIATAGDYLLGTDANFVTGSDLLIDGGVIAASGSSRRLHQ